MMLLNGYKKLSYRRNVKLRIIDFHKLLKKSNT